jgi:hypothetical protein
VRTDHRSGTIDAYLTPAPAASAPASASARAAALAGSVLRKRRAEERGEGPLGLAQLAEQQAAQRAAPRPRRGPAVASALSSVRALVAEVDAAAHEGLVELMREHTFVGMVRGN